MENIIGAESFVGDAEEKWDASSRDGVAGINRRNRGELHLPP